MGKCIPAGEINFIKRINSLAAGRDIQVICTDDGSSSLFIPAMNETYHSRHGALRESRHVFIENGLLRGYELFDEIRLLEVGFGTGLNAWLTLDASANATRKISYTTLEPFPLEAAIYKELSFDVNKHVNEFTILHTSPWDKRVAISDQFELFKSTSRLQDFIPQHTFNLVYYDAFGPPAQPDMWTQEVFDLLSSMMDPGGILVTYCAKGQVRRNMVNSGMVVERLQGPPGKREMLRATRT